MNSRKLRRKKELQARKEARRTGKKVSEAISRTPKKCDECGASFDNSDKRMLNSWKIAVYDDGRIHLVCPACVPEEVKSQ